MQIMKVVTAVSRIQGECFHHLVKSSVGPNFEFIHNLQKQEL